MALKPNVQECTIKEQIIEDLASGLTFQFVKRPPDAELGCHITICGSNLPFGNRNLVFSKTGEFDGGGTATGGGCKPSWLREVK